MTKNKIDLNIRKITNHPPSPVSLPNQNTIIINIILSIQFLFFILFDESKLYYNKIIRLLHFTHYYFEKLSTKEVMNLLYSFWRYTDNFSYFKNKNSGMSYQGMARYYTAQTDQWLWIVSSSARKVSICGEFIMTVAGKAQNITIASARWAVHILAWSPVELQRTQLFSCPLGT